MKLKSSAIVHFIDPLSVIAQIEVLPGNIIADFGCGAGYFSIPLSQAVGKEGMVYSLDILPQALEIVESKAKIAGVSNIIAERANLEKERGSKLNDNSADWVILKDMLFQNKGKDAIIKEAHRVLKPRGKALLVEWSDKNFSIGPEKKLRIPTDDLLKSIKKNNFSVSKIINAGNFHYAMVIEKI